MTEIYIHEYTFTISNFKEKNGIQEVTITVITETLENQSIGDYIEMAANLFKRDLNVTHRVIEGYRND